METTIDLKVGIRRLQMIKFGMFKSVITKSIKTVEELNIGMSLHKRIREYPMFNYNDKEDLSIIIWDEVLFLDRHLEARMIDGTVAYLKMEYYTLRMKRKH